MARWIVVAGVAAFLLVPRPAPAQYSSPPPAGLTIRGTPEVPKVLDVQGRVVVTWHTVLR